MPASPEETFKLFSDAFALERITPPWLSFRVLTPAPIEIGAGTVIEYALRLHRVPIRWRSRIAVWEPPGRFVDVQVNGPYKLWEHTHLVESDGSGGTIIRDNVRYMVPLGPLGELARLGLVRRDLDRIFEFRRHAVGQLLTNREADPDGHRT